MKNELALLIAVMLVMVSFFAAQQLLTGRATQECTDSDNGLDYYTKGTVSIGGETLEDVCQEQSIVEYFCAKNSAQVKLYPCSDGCENGACKKTPSVPSIKEGKKFGTGNNQLEIGEYLGDVIPVLTARDFTSLESNTISTGRSITQYNQYLRFKDTSLQSGRILFTEDDKGQVQDYLTFSSSNYTFEYELEFTPGLTSAIKSGVLSDLLQNQISILGRTYTIIDATKSGTSITLALLAGSIQDELTEGESKTYTVNGKEYQIKVINIDDTARKASFSINGKTTGQRSVGEIEIADNLVIGVTRILTSEAAEQPDRVTFTLGAGRVELTDNDFTDENFTQAANINGRLVDNTFVKMRGTGTTDTFTLSSLKYRLKAESTTANDIYIPPGKGLSDKLRYPEALLADWDIVYHGLTSAKDKAPVKIDPHGSGYSLSFTNAKGQRFNIPFVTNNNGNLQMGDGTHSLYFLQAASSSTYTIAQDDDIILTNQNDPNGVTHVVRYSNIDIANKKIIFDDLAEGKKEIIYSGTEGTDAAADLVISGSNYRVFIGPAPEYKLAMDLNHDGDVDGDEVNIVLFGGGLLDLGASETPATNFNITITTKANQFDTQPATDEIISITMQVSGSSMNLDLPTQSSLTVQSTDNKNIALSNFGVFIKEYLDSVHKLYIEYPDKQAIGDVELIFKENAKPLAVKKPQQPQEGPQRHEPQPQVEQQPVQQEQPAKPIVTYEKKETGFRVWITKMIEKIKSWF